MSCVLFSFYSWPPVVFCFFLMWTYKVVHPSFLIQVFQFKLKKCYCCVLAHLFSKGHSNIVNKWNIYPESTHFGCTLTLCMFLLGLNTTETYLYIFFSLWQCSLFVYMRTMCCVYQAIYSRVSAEYSKYFFKIFPITHISSHECN